MASKFGGVSVEEKKSKFGGVSEAFWRKHQEDQSAMTYPEAITGANYADTGQSAPQSLANLAEGALMPIYRPKQFGKSMGNLVEGMAEKSLSSIMNSISLLAGEDERVPSPKWDAIVGEVTKSYDSPEALRDTIENDPYAIIADAFSLGWAGLGAAKMARKAPASIPESVPIGMYEEIAKLTNTKEFRNPAKRREVLKSWLEEGIPFTEAGTRKMGNIIEAINDEITAIIRASPDVKVRRDAVLAGLAPLRAKLDSKFGGTDSVAMIDRAVASYEKTIQRQIDQGKTEYFSLSELNDFKKDAWKNVTDWSPAKPNIQKLEDKIYQSVGGESAKIMGDKVPAIKPLNERQAPLLAGREQQMNAVNRISKHNKLLNMSALIGTGSGELIGSMMGMPGLGTGLGAAAYLLGKPGAKAPLARQIYNARKRAEGAPVPQSDIDLLNAMYAAYASRADREEESPANQPYR